MGIVCSIVELYGYWKPPCLETQKFPNVPVGLISLDGH